MKLMSQELVDKLGEDFRERMRDRRNFMRDRYNGCRVRYMAHAGGYVMVRKPRAMPYVMTEKAWLQLPFLGE